MAYINYGPNTGQWGTTGGWNAAGRNYINGAARTPAASPVFSAPPLPSYNNIFQVMGLDSAKEFQIGPNSKVLLMDANEPVFYIKESDDSGYSVVKSYRFSEIHSDDEQPENSPVVDTTMDDLKKAIADIRETSGKFVTKEDLEEFKTMIEDLVMRDE